MYDTLFGGCGGYPVCDTLCGGCGGYPKDVVFCVAGVGMELLWLSGKMSYWLLALRNTG